MPVVADYVELETVRAELDRLVARRLNGSFSSFEERRYLELVRREHELLARLLG